MRTLHLTLKKKWFDMIASGEKKEEYRDLKVYWADRLCSKIMCNTLLGYLADIDDDVAFREFDSIKFTNGYGKNAPVIYMRCEEIVIGTGKTEWGAEEGVEYFVIKLGNKMVTSEHMGMCM